jgi:hypothetical protein
VLELRISDLLPLPFGSAALPESVWEG